MTDIATPSRKGHRFSPVHPAGAYRRLYRSTVMDRIGLITRGVHAADAKAWLDIPVIGTMLLLQALDLPAATFNRKVKAQASLSAAESERVIGFARLIGQVEAMVEDSGDPAGFDARSWLAHWLTEPLPALGHAKPIDFMNTMEGQALVSRILAQAVSGAYA
jgi:putative toxin-antitoxin system antitoxin component (TIGR02293 family)